MKHEPDIFDLDITRLDEEWTQQPRLYKEQADKLADARAEYERMKADQDLVEAELDRDIRRYPQNYGLSKITEGAVKTTILLQKEYKAALTRTITTKHDVDVLVAAVTALDHRKKALENLVQLWLASYFSEPRVKNEVREEMENHRFRKRVKPVPAPAGRKSR